MSYLFHIKYQVYDRLVDALILKLKIKLINILRLFLVYILFYDKNVLTLETSMLVGAKRF